MALTLKTNGSSGSNIIQAAWFNDFYNLLTGSMADQWVTVNNGLQLKATAYTTPTAPTLALLAGTGLSIGSYTYAVAFGMGPNAQTVVGTTAAITTTTGNQQVSLTALPTGPAGTNERVIYRSKVGTTSPLFKVAAISDNTTTTYTDTTADASLGGASQAHNQFGGTLQTADVNGNVKGQVFSDGAVWFDSGGITSDGGGNLSLQQIFAANNINLAGGKQIAFDYPTPVQSEGLGNLYIVGVAGASNPDFKINNGVGNIILSALGGGLILNSSPIVVNGTTAGTATLYTLVIGTLKVYYLLYSGYENTTATEQKLTLPQAFSTRATFFALGGQPITHFYLSGSQLSSKCSIQNSLPSGSGPGNATTQSAVNGFSIGEITSGFDQIGLSVSDSQVLTGGMIFFGV